MNPKEQKNVIREILNNYAHINQNLEKLKGDDIENNKALSALIDNNLQIQNILSKNL